MHDIRTIATNDRNVYQFVCHAASLGFDVQKRKAKQIEILFRIKTFGAQGTLSDGGLEPPTSREGGFDVAFALLLWSLVIADVVYLLCSIKTLSTPFSNV